jgi:mannose-1-phosphate guanylyltransferase
MVPDATKQVSATANANSSEFVVFGIMVLFPSFGYGYLHEASAGTIKRSLFFLKLSTYTASE